MTKPIALGANIFAGGFTVGVQRHFRVLGHLEHDDYAVATAHKNLGLPIYVGTEEWPKKPPQKIDFLYSNPPCAVWSVASPINKGGKDDIWMRDPRLQRIRDIFGLVDQYRPKVWCWESVCGAFERGRRFVEELANAAEKRGYCVSYVLVDAQYLKTCQVRKRFFLVLHRIEINWAKATPDFTSRMTVGQVMGSVKPNKDERKRINARPFGSRLEDKYIHLVKPGDKFLPVFEQVNKKKKVKRNVRGGVIGRPSFLKSRLDRNGQTGVVFGDHTYHWKEPRLLAISEVGALYGFPKDWNWVGADIRDPQRGVLPNVGEWLAKNVAAAVKANKPMRKHVRQLVDFRKPPGSIETVGRLPNHVNLDWKPPK